MQRARVERRTDGDKATYSPDTFYINALHGVVDAVPGSSMVVSVKSGWIGAEQTEIDDNNDRRQSTWVDILNKSQVWQDSLVITVQCSLRALALALARARAPAHCWLA